MFILLSASGDIDENTFGMTSEWIVVITICTLLMLLACGVGIGICICRKKTSYDGSRKAQMNQTDVNGSKHLNCYRPAVLGKNRRNHATFIGWV